MNNFSLNKNSIITYNDLNHPKLYQNLNNKYCSNCPKPIYKKNVLPKFFDAREKWSGLISDILDQGSCNSCWAFCTAQSFSDRIRIFSSYGFSEKTFSISPRQIKINEFNIEKTDSPLLIDFVNVDNNCVLDSLSPYHFTVCKICNFNHYFDDNINDSFDNNGSDFLLSMHKNEFCNMGCNGGYLQHCHIYLLLEGLVALSQFPFTNLGKSLKCPSSKDLFKFKAKRIYPVTKSYWSNSEKEHAIMNEIFIHGPVSCGFLSYDDFENQSNFTSTGLYHSSSKFSTSKNSPEGHAVSIIGWGEELVNNSIIPYWLCRNSFGRNFVNKGYFKIRRGSNFCLIEDDVWGIEPFAVYDYIPSTYYFC